MSVLNNRQIEDAIGYYNLIDPFDKNQLNPNSYDFRLSGKFCRAWTEITRSYDSHGWTDTRTYKNISIVLDKRDVENHLIVEDFEADKYTLGSGENILALTEEYFSFPPNICGMVKQKSSLGRLFLSVCNGDAGWVDSGFTGQLVIELRNNSPFSITLTKGMRIGQIIFMYSGFCIDGYSGHYVDQRDFKSDKWKESLIRIGEGK